MSLTVKLEEITPAMAHQYLALSVGNRRLSQNFVLTLAVSMESGKWNPGASEIVFDETDALIDGHHRLNAIIAYDKPVSMLVKRGVTKEARGVIDTGRTRSAQDLFTMFRPEVTYATRRRAALNVCVSLVVPNPPSLRTLDAIDSWTRHFKEGIDATLEVSTVGSTKDQPLLLGPVLGAFAFAHRTAPSKVIHFMTRVRDGAGLAMNEPAYTLRALIHSPSARGGGRGGDRMLLTRKVLQAIFADMKGKSFIKAQAGNEGLEYFRKAYDLPAINKLVNLWTSDGTQQES